MEIFEIMAPNRINEMPANTDIIPTITVRIAITVTPRGLPRPG